MHDNRTRIHLHPFARLLRPLHRSHGDRHHHHQSKYTVIGIGGFGGNALLSLIAGGSVWLLWINRRRTRRLAKCGLILFLLAAATFTISGCSGKSPDLNSSYTPADSYTYTLTATDGIITHTATYSLKVTVN